MLLGDDQSLSDLLLRVYDFRVVGTFEFPLLDLFLELLLKRSELGQKSIVGLAELVEFFIHNKKIKNQGIVDQIKRTII